MLDEKTCFEAVLARDRRFDGKFFTGVVTTGVYCRPICPSRTPQQKNCRFFAHTIAAREAGFRPCKRCRPEGAPGTVSWPGTSETVVAALKLISEGAVAEGGIVSLAGKLSISERQLRRLFSEYLGTTPGAVVASRKTSFAAKLLVETDLKISDVAFASGFGSLRRFNHAMRDAYGRPPGQIRGKHGGRRGDISIKLSYRPPLEWERTIGFIGRRTLDCLESFEDGIYRRLVLAGDMPVAVTITPMLEESNVKLTIDPPQHNGLLDIAHKVRGMLDLDADPSAIDQALCADPLLRPLTKARPGLRLPRAWDPFEAAIRAVIGQRVSLRSACTFTNRLLARYGKPVEGFEDFGLSHAFPTPEALADAELNGIGITTSRALTIRAISAAIADGALKLEPRADIEDLIAELCEIPGIGPWTANYIAMRGLGEPDALMASDLGVLKAARVLGIGQTPAEITAHAQRWRPWRAYAVMHLWTELEERTRK